MDLKESLIELSGNHASPQLYPPLAPPSPDLPRIPSSPLLPPASSISTTLWPSSTNHLFPRRSTKLSNNRSSSATGHFSGDLFSSITSNKGTRRNAKRASKYNITQDSVHQILENLKIALTFLLHDNSPIANTRHLMFDGHVLSKCEQVLNALFDETYSPHYASLHRLWSKWTQSDVDFGSMIENNAQMLEDDCADFIHAINVAKPSQYGRTSAATASSKALSNVRTRKQMKEWITQYKSDTHEQRYCMSNSSVSKEEKNVRMFVDLWSWQNVVAAIEDAVHIDQDGQQFRLKHFASVFWQYQINGKELLAMNAQQMQFLVESWCVNNIGIQLQDQMVQSQLSAESEWLKAFIDKLRINSHCIARYYLSMDIVDWVIFNAEDSAYYEDAINIKFCIESLRSRVEDGPNQYWKLNAHFFNKIDNYLSVLIVQPQIRQMYSICFPHFIDQIHQHTADNTSYIQHAVLNSNKQCAHSSKKPLEYVEEDLLDTCTDKCCLDDYIKDYVHNLDRFYIKIACLMVLAVVLGSVLIISFYHSSGTDQANDAMFLSLEAIGDRASLLMAQEFWIPQIFASLAIGGLTTGDLHPNASLYTYPHYRFDEFFTAFTTASHTTAVFSVFMYNSDLNTIIGARRHKHHTYIVSFDDGCRTIRRYNASLKMRDMKDHSIKEHNCTYNPHDVPWYALAHQIGVGRSQWTEPYVFADARFSGMSYVAPVMWKNHHLIFVVQVTTLTLAKAVSQEVQQLPRGSLWMIVTPGNNVPASSTNKTMMDVPGCPKSKCATNDSKIVAAIDWMKENEIDKQEHFSSLAIGEYQISIYSFKMNHVNLYPPKQYTQSNQYMNKWLELNNESDYQYGYVVIVNDDSYLQEIGYAWWLSCALALLSLVCIIAWIGCNARYNNMEQEVLARQGRSRSTLIRVMHSKRLQIVESNMNLFQKVASVNIQSSVETPVVGDRVETSNHQFGIVQFVGGLQDKTHFGLKLHTKDASILVNLDDIVRNLGPPNDAANSRLLSVASGSIIKEDESDTSSEDEMKSHLPHIASFRTSFTGSYITSDSESTNECTDDKYWFDSFCFITQKWLRRILFACVMIELIGIVGIWETLTTNATEALFQNLMATHEWLSIQDEVYQLHDFTEIITDVIRDRFYRNNMDLSNSESLNRFLMNIMQTFVAPSKAYLPWVVYMATPNGNMHGVISSDNVSTLFALRLDQTTNYSYGWYGINDTTGDVLLDDWQYQNRIYDARCRDWYVSAIYYGFDGTLKQAFPDDTYKAWLSDASSPTASITNCVNSKATFNAMFAASNLSEYDEWSNNAWKYIGAQSHMVWRRKLFTVVDEIGLTASKPIVDPFTGELLAVVAVDHRLEPLSQALSNGVQNPYDTGRSSLKYDKWKAWIFEASNDHAMIASSGGHDEVLHSATEETQGCYGTSAVENPEVPYLADSHPNDLITVYSKEVLFINGLDDLHVNATLPEKINLPPKMPILEAGRIVFYPQSNSGIDWIIMKTMDVSSCFVDDFFISEVIVFGVLICIWVVVPKVRLVRSPSATPNEINKKMERDDYLRIMNQIKPMVQGAANIVWANSMKNESIITTQDAKQFLADRANKHITCSNENNYVFRECVWYAAAAAPDAGHRFKFLFWRFIESNYYDVPIQLCLLGHLIATFWEPDTPLQLRENGVSTQVMILLGVFQLIQWNDCILIGIKRYFEYNISDPFLTCLFEVNYGSNHKYTKRLHKYTNGTQIMNRALYLTFMGPQGRRYVCQLLFVCCDFINFLLMIVVGIAPFSYYVPILPCLIMIRNQRVLFFGYDLFCAIFRARGVLFSYFCFILLFTIFTMTLFRDLVHEDSFVDSFESTRSAFITAFVFITTQENYSIMYDVFHSAYYATSHWMVLGYIVTCSIAFAMMGMFYWIPMIIDQFEQYFEESNMHKDKKMKQRKTNAIIASFVMLDLNCDMDIDQTEFENLIFFSDLLDADKSALFAEMDDNNNNSLDVFEYVECLLKQSFRTKVMDSQSNNAQSKCAALMECNIFRARFYTMYIFVFLTAPVIALSCIKGLNSGFDGDRIDCIIVLFFIANMVEIHLRMFCFGMGRFWDLLKYPNPRYIVAAINNYNKKYKKQKTDNINIERLTAAERQWVSHYLHDIRPLSILEKSTQTLINRIEILMFWLFLSMFFAFKLLFVWRRHHTDTNDTTMYGSEGDITSSSIEERYCMHLIQNAVMIRLFTLIPSNQKLVYIVFVIAPKFIALFAFLSLYTYGWARIGCAAFGDHKTDIVIGEIYDVADSIVTNFNSLPYAILSLIQVMIGEGWQEVMYYNIIATTDVHYIYFVSYFTVVSLIAVNIFVGLFLADIDEFTQQQSYDALMQNSESNSTKLKIVQKINSLKYWIDQNNAENDTIKEQIQNLKNVLETHHCN
eukprot:43936_1